MIRRTNLAQGWTALLALVAVLVLVRPAHAAADELKVLATLPDLADIVEAVGGERVDVTAIARGTENVHAVALRPSALVAANRAELFVQVGLSLEHAWVPGLLERSRNQRIQPGAPGFVNASEGFVPLDVPDEVSRRQSADLHPQGNPHINLDPRAGRHFAGKVLEGLVRVDPEGAEFYRERHARYLERLDAAEARWAASFERMGGQRVVVYHAEYRYLAVAAGIEVAARLEPRPGIPPTPGHLAEVIGLMREEGIDLILTAKWSNNSAVDRVAKATGARVLELPTMVRGAKSIDTWIGLMDRVVGDLEAALAPEERGPEEPGPPEPGREEQGREEQGAARR